jgi:hypothetical protein
MGMMVWGEERGTSYTNPSRKIQNDPPQNFNAQECGSAPEGSEG